MTQVCTRTGKNEQHEQVHIELNKWLNEHPEITLKIPDKLLEVFEKRCNYNVEKTQEKIRNFAKARIQSPEWFLNRDPTQPEILDILQLGCFLPLINPYQNQLVIISRAAAHNPSKHKQNDVLKCSLMILDLLIFETGIPKVQLIIDMNNVTLSHATTLSPRAIKKLVYCWKNYSTKPVRFDFINAPSYVNIVLDIFKRFTSDKMKSKIFIHYSGYESVFNHIPRDIFPEEYGGKTQSIPQLIQYWSNKLIGNRNWFLNEN